MSGRSFEPRDCIECATPMVAMKRTPPPGFARHAAHGICDRCRCERRRRERGVEPFALPIDHWGRPCLRCRIPTVPFRTVDVPEGHRRRHTHLTCQVCYRVLRRQSRPAGPPLTDDQRQALTRLLCDDEELAAALGLHEDLVTVMDLDCELAFYAGIARGHGAVAR